MEFLDSMLEGIIAFQQYRHPAWNETSPFEERISRLPLYALEFNHPDRDAKLHGPTIAHYAPDQREIAALAQTIGSIGSCLCVLDVGCGNGFVGSLLAREGVPVVGIDDHSWHQPQIPRFHDPGVYQLRAPLSLEDFNEEVDVTFCSWMVPGSNLTKLLVGCHPKLIIQVYSPDCERGGLRETGTNDAYILPDGYMRLGAWAACTPENFISHAIPGIPPKYQTVRIVEIWSRKDMSAARVYAPTESESTDPYYWDSERSALNEIRISQGLPLFEIHTVPTFQVPSLFQPLI